MTDEQDDKNDTKTVYILPNYEVLISVAMNIPAF
jgi:hypothetical protein